MFLIEDYERELEKICEACIECGCSPGACKLSLVKCCPDCTHLHYEPSKWLHMGAFGLCSDAGEVSRLMREHLYLSAPLDSAKLIPELGRVLERAAFLARHSDTRLFQILGVNAFSDYECVGIFSGPEAAIMAMGSLAVDSGRLMNALLFHEAVYSRPREFQRVLAGVVWCVGNLATYAGSSLQSVAMLDIEAVRAEHAIPAPIPGPIPSKPDPRGPGPHHVHAFNGDICRCGVRKSELEEKEPGA